MKTIPLTKGYRTMIDDEDYEQVKEYNWYANCAGNFIYACRRISYGPLVYLEKFLMKPPDGFMVDHIDGNGLNNQRSNLRIATRGQNNVNRKGRGYNGYKGIMQRPTGKWYIQLGSFDTAEEAARAHDKVAKELYGNFAVLNFPEK